MANPSSGSLGGFSYGQILFSFLVGFQVILLTFITPGLTSGAISSERERQTIDLLFVTRLRPFSIIWGKLLASMSFVVLLLVLSVPIFSLVFLFGGIELDQVVYAFLVTLVTALTLGALGIAFSTWLRRSLVATVVSYVGAFVLIVGTLAFGLFFPTDIDPNAKKAPAPPAITYLSPVISLMWIAGDGQLLGAYGVRYSNGTLSMADLGLGLGPFAKPLWVAPPPATRGLRGSPSSPIAARAALSCSLLSQMERFLAAFSRVGNTGRRPSSCNLQSVSSPCLRAPFCCHPCAACHGGGEVHLNLLRR